MESSFRKAAAAVLITTTWFVILLATGVLGTRGTMVVDDVGITTAAFVAAIVCAARARRTSSSVDRSAWSLLGLASLCWAAGDAIWTVNEAVLGDEVPFPSWADAGSLAFVPLAAAGLTVLAAGDAEPSVRLRAVLQGCAVSSAVFFVSWATVLGPAVEGGSGSRLERSLTIAYPLADIVLVTIAISALARAGGGRRIMVMLVSCGLLGLALSDTMFLWLVSQDAYGVGNAADAGWFAGFLLLTLAALHGSEPGEAAAPGPTSSLAAGLPYVPIALAAGTGFVAEREGRLDPVLFYDGIVMVMVILVHQFVVIIENQRLTHRLEESVHELERLALHDSLTGVANRELFNDRLRCAMVRRPRSGRLVGLLYLDLDAFKAVNDRRGHGLGDQLLRSVADRLLAAVRPVDTVARLGGDEFGIVLPDIRSQAEGEAVMERVSLALLAPHHLDDADVSIHVSVGLAVSCADDSSEDLIRRADHAMYEAKSRSAEAQRAVEAST